MEYKNSSKGKYVLAALCGAAVGGSIVAFSTRAIPKMMSGMMAGMMDKMEECGCGDMCQQMMAGKEDKPEQRGCQSSEHAACA